MLEALFGKLLGWIPSPWSAVRLRYTITAKLCTYAHVFIAWAGEPLPRVPPHVDVTLELWVPEHRTTVRAITAQAAKQQLQETHVSFRPMTLDPGAKPEEQTVALGPPGGEQLRASAGDTVAVRLVLTRGRPRKLKATIEPERD